MKLQTERMSGDDMATLQSTKFTLANWADDDRWAWFDDAATERTRVRRGLSLPLDTWRDMGSPDVLTVTIEPGDRLNV